MKQLLGYRPNCEHYGMHSNMAIIERNFVLTCLIAVVCCYCRFITKTREFIVIDACSRDVHKTLSHKTQTVNIEDWDKTETFHVFKLSRPRRDQDAEPSRLRRDRDVRFFQLSRPRRSKKRLETTSRQRRSRPRRHPWHAEPLCSHYVQNSESRIRQLTCETISLGQGIMQMSRSAMFKHAERACWCQLILYP